MFRPTPPQPTTATASPGRTRAVFSTAPNAVMTAQPMSAISLSGRAGSIGIAVWAGTTVRSPNDDVVEWWMSAPLRWNLVVPSIMSPASDHASCSHTFGRPDTQKRHRPQCGSQLRMT